MSPVKAATSEQKGLASVRIKANWRRSMAPSHPEGARDGVFATENEICLERLDVCASRAEPVGTMAAQFAAETLGRIGCTQIIGTYIFDEIWCSAA